jgi:hypothetical protein
MALQCSAFSVHAILGPESPFPLYPSNPGVLKFKSHRTPENLMEGPAYIHTTHSLFQASHRPFLLGAGAADTQFRPALGQQSPLQALPC